MRKAVFLDRDGVLNKAIVKNGKPYPPSSLEELKIDADTLPALRRLKEKGYLLIGATNQPDVARGTTPKSFVESINNVILDKLPLDEMRVCYHDDVDQCDCRKPRPGLLTKTASDLNIDLKNSFMIGDRWKDVAAGKSAGCKTIWLDCAYDEKFSADKADVTVLTLTEAIDWIIKQEDK